MEATSSAESSLQNFNFLGNSLLAEVDSMVAESMPGMQILYLEEVAQLQVFLQQYLTFMEVGPRLVTKFIGLCSI